MDLTECMNKGFIRKTKINKNLVLSLIEISDIKVKTVQDSNLNDITINAFLPLIYDSLREVLEAYCILEGFKVGNHICIGLLVKKFEKNFDLNSFDRFRYIRNGINYYGTKVNLEEGKILITSILNLRETILEKINIKLKKYRV